MRAQLVELDADIERATESERWPVADALRKEYWRVYADLADLERARLAELRT